VRLLRTYRVKSLSRQTTLMKRPYFFLITLFAMSMAIAEDKTSQTRMTWKVDGVEREALVDVPSTAKTEATPLVFAFHGHGGRMMGAVRMFRIHEVWPEAIVVYPQGLKTPGKLTDPEGKKPGWQSGAGNQEDRDLKFFDAMLADLSKKFKVDAKRVYSTGHSNGGAFTYLLWAERGEKLAAVAPSAAIGDRDLKKAKPLPVMHLAGAMDPLVKFTWQEIMIGAVKRMNGCSDQGQEWADLATLFASEGGTPLVTVIHPGGHEFLESAPELITRFFKSQKRK
jgi:polyhydroxybutyrate depolymerase